MPMPTILALKGEDFKSVTAWRIEAWQIVAGQYPNHGGVGQ
jgi:hypothetical protein